jgi:hypothetical protein
MTQPAAHKRVRTAIGLRLISLLRCAKCRLLSLQVTLYSAALAEAGELSARRLVERDPRSDPLQKLDLSL